MSVTFSIIGEDSHCDEFCDECFAQIVNMSNYNAGDFLAALGLPVCHEAGLWGDMRAKELRPLLERLRDSDVSSKINPHREDRVVFGGRREGYFQERARDLLKLCERAGELGVISWG